MVANSRALTAALIKRGYSFVTDGTDNHLSMWDVRPQGTLVCLLVCALTKKTKGLNGGKMEWLFDLVHITVNKNTVYGDSSALTPGGIR